jgi:hypothetical protein
VAAVVVAEIIPASTRLQDDGEIHSQPLSRVDGRRISKCDGRRLEAAVVAAEILRRLRAFRMTENFFLSLSG